MYEIQIETDYNDGDYLIKICEISEDKLNKFRPLIAAIKRQCGNFGTGYGFKYNLKELYPNFNEDLMEDFLYYCPSDQDVGFHTIESIIVFPSPEKEILL